eukprot:Gb_34866 [translate_table: standard]
MIDQQIIEQSRRHSEIVLMPLHNGNLGYNLQSIGIPVGISVATNSERDFLSCGVIDSDSIANSQVFAPSNEGFMAARPQPNFCSFTNFQEVQSLPQNQGHALKDGPFFQRSWDYMMQQEIMFQNAPFKMHPQGNAQELQLQDFQYFVVIDFEATCDTGTHLYPQEIIEFPAVLVNSMTGRLEGHFQTYVKPVHHPVLTDFCKELTGIQQNQVDGGVSLSEALSMHDKWLKERGVKNTNFVVVTWSNWDCKVMLESECKLKGIRKPQYFNRWINLKVPFYGAFGKLRCNLKGAVQSAGLVWEGRAHCGLDDAKNTSRLLVDLMRRGIKLSITNSMLYASDGSKLPLPKLKQPKTLVGGNFLPQASIMQGLGNSPFSNTLDEVKDMGTLCFCGVRSNKCMVKKPGPTHGNFFFACGNWTVTRGAQCRYFEWAVPDIRLNA